MNRQEIKWNPDWLDGMERLWGRTWDAAQRGEFYELDHMVGCFHGVRMVAPWDSAEYYLAELLYDLTLREINFMYGR